MSYCMRQEQWPRREYWVGGSTVKTIVGQKFIPGLLDLYLGKTPDTRRSSVRSEIRLIGRTMCGIRFRPSWEPMAPLIANPGHSASKRKSPSIVAGSYLAADS